MADGVEKTYLVNVIVKGDEALAVQQRLRSDTDMLIEKYREFQQQYQETFALAQKAVDQLTTKQLRNDIERTKQAVLNLRRVLAKETPMGQKQITGETRVKFEDQIIKRQQTIAALQERIVQLKQASALASKEVVAQQNKVVKTTMSAAQGAQVYTTNVAKATTELKGLIKGGLSAEAAMVGMTKEGKFSSKELTAALKNVRGNMREVGKETSKTSRILERIFAAAIIGVVLNAMRRFINGIKEMVDASKEAQREFIQFVLEIQNIQETGLDVTIQEWNDRIDALGKRFTQFNREELRDGVSRIIRLGRQIGLTDEEIVELTDHIAVLATVTGKDFIDAVDSAIQSIRRGRVSEAFSELFGGIDEPTLNTEAVRRGFAETTEEVDQYTRFLVVMEMAQEEAAKSGEKLALVQEHISGEMEQVNEDIKDQSDDIGTLLLPMQKNLHWSYLRLLKFLEVLADQGSRLFIAWAATVLGAIGAITAGLKGQITDFQDFVQVLEQSISIAGEILMRELRPDLLEEFEDKLDQTSDAARRAAPSLTELAAKFKEAFDTIRDIVSGMTDDIAEGMAKFEQKVIDDAERFALKLAQLFEKLQFNIAKANRSFNDKIVEAQDDYRDREIEAEEDYQEKLRKLREQFLFDLEDALRERDARQIIRLIRQYNLKKTQLGRERDLEKEENKRRLQDDLEDIERQRAARIRELKLEYQLRRAQMIAQNELEKQLRREEHERRMEEIRQEAKEKLGAFLDELVGKGELTVAEAKLIADAFDVFFGPTGEIAQSVDGLSESIDKAIGEIIVSIRSLYRELNQPVSLMDARSSELQGLEGPNVKDVDFDTEKLKSQAKKITKAFDDEFGPQGEATVVFDKFRDKVETIVKDEIPAALLDKEGTLSTAAKGVVAFFAGIFGAGGETDRIFDYLVGSIQAAVSAVITAIQRLQAALAGLSNISFASAPNAPAGTTAGPFAEGGTLFADRPTTVTFGEAGPEIAQFTPLNRAARNAGEAFGDPVASRNDRIELMVRMEDGLIAEIIDTTLDQTATVVLNVERATL